MTTTFKNETEQLKFLSDFKNAEYHGHMVAYMTALGTPGQEFIDLQETTPSGETQSSRYRAKRMDTTPGGGVYAQILSSTTEPKVKINLQGTLPGDGTLAADKRRDGPGYRAFMEQEENIMRQISNALKVQSRLFPGQKIDVEISGHSLGGALTQIMHTEMLKAMTTKKVGNKLNLYKNEQAPFQNIGSITANCINPAGVNAKVRRELEKYSSKAQKRFGITNQANLLMVDGDPVQQTSETNAYANIDHKVMPVQMMKCKRGYEGISSDVYVAAGSAAAAIGVGAMTGGIGLAPALVAAGAMGLGAGAARKGYNGVAAHIDQFFDHEKDLYEQKQFQYEWANNQSAAGRKFIKREAEYKSGFMNNGLGLFHGIGRMIKRAGGGECFDNKLQEKRRQRSEAILRGEDMRPEAIAFQNEMVKQELLASGYAPDTLSEPDTDIEPPKATGLTPRLGRA